MANVNDYQFMDVEGDELGALEQRRTGETSRIAQAFLQTGKYAVKVPLQATDDNAAARLAGALGTYLRNNKMPAKALVRDGVVFLRRIDVDKNNNPIQGWESLHTKRGRGNHNVSKPAGSAASASNGASEAPSSPTPARQAVAAR